MDEVEAPGMREGSLEDVRGWTDGHSAREEQDARPRDQAAGFSFYTNQEKVLHF